ncbi:hypothetical protein ACFVWG_08105 [Kribbella sp. NPDC058245]|uniref:hypothetical protein n=1 Tax=Kribbella sp. NPDC058245 TaxID=3346399 RepID=UPI0036E7BEE2
MSDFIQGFTENMGGLSTRTTAYGQDLESNATRTASVVLDMNGSWRGPGYNSAAMIGDEFQAGVRGHHARVHGRAAGINTVTNHYDAQIGSEVHVTSSVGPLTA